MGVKEALEKYSRRHSGGKKKRAKNSRPEKEVEKEVVEWLRQSGFDCSVVESKAVYSRGAGRYLRGQAEPGFSDLAGVTPTAVGCFIELKAVGKRANVSKAQYDFLCRKIRMGAFACCVDSVNCLAETYRTWYLLNKETGDAAKNYLLSLLPEKFVDDEFTL